ncbi:phosphoribosylanthranilate isomerase [Dermatophilus congolensis]|uniref:phosphoribosylanthranilate isomerase n=1 Tax=Dermatophilus congolensis TaxID=1863 RepID=UPI001AAF1106|nr:phosphoribosylanthranilate isomerase [Dermatophilus congolensis]MBO3130858.1 phosphoribosylanthranilate isomerase [Dermatophilus congolensis]MBO3134984.1 phosphoribosylanthranilate isomerase [Dermatophilus congolensis]MBO3137223.1 phosphoribosylanthranilate isomerase [Dermatophilus congolensis]MBO3139468.1 phosphoribosylanthranilate isomerase [Dermatophilus congolensis]
MFVKICGITSVSDARVAVQAGADAVGVVMSNTSARGVGLEVAGQVVEAVGGCVSTVFVTNDLPADVAAGVAGKLGFSVLQLHGSGYGVEDFVRAGEVFPRVWRATSFVQAGVLDASVWGVELLLLDAPRPGAGRVWDWSVVRKCPPVGKWVLAGGLHPGNVAEAVRVVSPWGVDVASGVEVRPGVKDPEKVFAFVEAARSV